MLCATTACTFSTAQLPKVLRTWCVLCILTSKCASRHNGVHFFDITTSKSAPKLRFFVVHFDFEMCFAPQPRAIFQLSFGQLAPHRAYFSTLRVTNHWKNTVFRDFPTFSRTWVFFLLIFFKLIFFFFSSLLFSDSSHPCFSSVHIVRSLTSKLPSITRRLIYWLQIPWR